MGAEVGTAERRVTLRHPLRTNQVIRMWEEPLPPPTLLSLLPQPVDAPLGRRLAPVLSASGGWGAAQPGL